MATHTKKTQRLPWLALARAMRIGQWPKNALVGAAFIFALGDQAQEVRLADFPRVLGAIMVFCLASSAVYLFNDLVDRRRDRDHPVKRLRPVASGALAPLTAGLASLALLVPVSVLGLALDFGFALVVAAYLALQVCYSLLLKRVALVDVIALSLGFVLRAVAGAVVIRVFISPWLLLCAFLLALFLALCKRRHEKNAVTDNQEAAQRPALDGYETRLLDQLIAIVSAVTLAAYAMYTLSAATTGKFGTAGLGLTIPFVVFGLFRYLDLVYRHRRGDRPEMILLTDLPTIVNLALYGITVLLVFYFA